MHPPTDTFAENYYYLKQMNKKTPMAVVFTDGEVLEGYIEWYDRNCIKLNRDNAPNMLVYKSHIKYIYKLGEAPEPGPGRIEKAQMTLPAVGISLGDPGGIGPEVALKALADSSLLPEARFVVFGDRPVWDAEREAPGIRIEAPIHKGDAVPRPPGLAFQGYGPRPGRRRPRPGDGRERAILFPGVRKGRRMGRTGHRRCRRHRSHLQDLLAPGRAVLAGTYGVSGFPLSPERS